MSIRSIVLRGYGNGSIKGTISLIAVRGYGKEGPAHGGYMPHMTYDFEEAERQERQRLLEEAQLVEEIQDMLGPSQELINNIWTVALLQIDEESGQVIEVQHDIDDRNLLRLTSKILTLGAIDSEKVMTSTIKSPDSKVTFMQTEDGWLFFRTKGSA